jgi:hypothetical protein
MSLIHQALGDSINNFFYQTLQNNVENSAGNKLLCPEELSTISNNLCLSVGNRNCDLRNDRFNIYKFIYFALVLIQKLSTINSENKKVNNKNLCNLISLKDQLDVSLSELDQCRSELAEARNSLLVCFNEFMKYKKQSEERIAVKDRVIETLESSLAS